MSWFADLAGRAENLLNNLDEQTATALRGHNVPKQRVQNKYEAYPEGNGQKKHPLTRNAKKLPHVSETRSNFSSNNQTHGGRKASPPSKPQFDLPVKEIQNYNSSFKGKKALRKPSSQLYHLDNCPKTLVGDAKDSELSVNQLGFRERKYSLPSDLEMVNRENMAFRMQNLEVENAMLKNELNVMNREVAEMLERLHKTEDGNDIVSSYKELDKAQVKLEDSGEKNDSLDKDLLSAQFQELKNKIDELTTEEVAKYKVQKETLENEVNLLTQKNKELEESINQLNDKVSENNTTIHKLETELRHDQSVISDLQNDLEKSKSECQRLEKDWETYKLRVKSMLHAKDNEIKDLQEGSYFTEDNKMLLKQLESLKQEREDLSEAVSNMRDECSNMRHHIEQLESRNNSAERVVTALRDALKEEHVARNKAEAHCMTLGKELKAVQMEMSQTIANLQATLMEKENEVVSLRDSLSSSIPNPDNSGMLALNVADYDSMQISIDNEKIHYLTEMLVQKQGKIDKLLADNNTLRIQLEKLETKYKTELAALRANAHSVVQVQDGDSRSRARSNKISTGSALAVLSVKMGVLFKRYPIFRVFIIGYMICLHFWVITVLFTSTPEDFLKKPTKS